MGGNTTISVSILGYEGQIAKRLRDIERILAGLDDSELHLDYMGGDEDDFIRGRSKPTFTPEEMELLVKEFADRFPVDFHLMLRDPDPTLEVINQIVPEGKRDGVTVTVHAEAYRPKDIGEWDRKEYDLLTLNTGDPALNARLREANRISREHVYGIVQAIAKAGYQPGVALEPGTSLGNVPARTRNLARRILRMTVDSGAGKQALKGEVLPKVAYIAGRYPNLVRQIDGGAKDHNLLRIIGRGANNIVMGSYFTAADDLPGNMRYINSLRAP